jgi:hypothetical protein
MRKTFAFREAFSKSEIEIHRETSAILLNLEARLMRNVVITTDLAFVECSDDEFPTTPRGSCFALA